MVARRHETVTYGELVEQAKAAYPDNETVQNAIPVSVGRRLDFVRSFTGQRQLPDLSSLVVNKTTGECDIGFTRSFNPEEARASVSAFDWRSVSTEFTGAVAAARKRSAPRKKRTEAAAAQVMYEYFTANKSSLPTDIKKYRPQILRLLIEGEEPSEAYAQGLKS